MVAGQSYDVAVSMKNTGNTTWQPGTWKLGSQAPQDNTIWGPNRVQLAAPVGPGGSVAFSFVVRAPTTPGIYTYKWQMVQEFVEFFGAPTTEYQINVAALPPPPPPAPVPTLTVTRTPTTMVANQSFTLNWSTTNATSLTRVCTSTGTGFVANGTLATSGSAPGTASSAWVGFPSTCTWTATGAGGSKQVIETMTTNAAAPPPPPPPPPSGPTVTYIHTDGLGSPVARTNEQGELISRIATIIIRQKRLRGGDLADYGFEELINSSRSKMNGCLKNNTSTDRAAMLNRLLLCALLNTEENDFFYLTEPMFEFVREMQVSPDLLAQILESEFIGFKI
jgi:Ig-like domain from next to BRCA1 gene